MSDPAESDRNREHDLEPEWDPSAHRLPVWATIRAATQSIAKEWKALLQAIAVPTLAVVALYVAGEREYVEAVFPDLSSPLQDLLQIVADSALSIVPLTMIAVSCHRLVILGVDSLPNAWGLFWSWRETRFLGWVFLLALVAVPLLLTATFLLSVSLEIPLARYTRPWLYWGVYLSVVLGLLSRLSLVLPATAIGQNPTLADSWRLTRSNGWRLALLVIPLALSLAPPEELLELPVSGFALLTLIRVLLLLVGIALLSKAFSWFTGEIEAKSPS